MIFERGVTLAPSSSSNDQLSRTTRYGVLAAFAHLMVKPVSAPAITYSILSAGLVAAMITIVRKRQLAIHPAVGLPTFIWVTVGALWSLIGGLRSNPGTDEAIFVHFLAPAAFAIYVGASPRRLVLYFIEQLPTLALFTAGTMVLLSLDLIPFAESLDLGLTSDSRSIVIRNGVAEARWHALSTFAFTAPYLMVSLTRRYFHAAQLGRPVVRLGALALTLTAVIISGRRGVLLASLVAFAAVVACRRTVSLMRSSAIAGSGIKHNLWMILLGAMAWLGVEAVGVNLASSVTQLAGSLTTEFAEGEIRWQQAKSLWSRFGESPIWGHGAGAVFEESIRDSARPWRHELQYLDLLAKTGLLGVATLGVSALLAAAAAIRAVRLLPSAEPAVAASIAGGLGLLIANASNPYLLSPARNWALFVPAAVVNVALTKCALDGTDLQARWPHGSSLRAERTGVS